MAYLSPASDVLGDDNGDDSDDWTSQMTSPYDDNLGPGPPPPEFLLPPPPLPDFMLQEMGGDCVQRSLPEHFANCDMSFVSFFISYSFDFVFMMLSLWLLLILLLYIIVLLLKYLKIAIELNNKYNSFQQKW